VSDSITEVFRGLVTNSDISFDVTNILNLNTYSWIGIFAVCLSILALQLLIDLLVTLAYQLIPDMRRLFAAEILVACCLAGIHSYLGSFSADNFSFSFVLVTVLVALRTWYGKRGRQFNMAVFISTLLLMAAVTAIKHGEFQRYKRDEAQKLVIYNLEAVDDGNAIALFYDLEKEIVKDPVLIDYFRSPERQDRDLLHEHLKRTYLSGYLSRYEFVAHEFDTNSFPIGSSSASKRLAYRDKVISGAIKVSENFYRGNSRFGNFEYFAQ